MKQRIGIAAHALAMGPQVLLMDGPFGTLDALTCTLTGFTNGNSKKLFLYSFPAPKKYLVAH